MIDDAAAAGPSPGSVAVTGATGFIGGRIARRLAANGWHVRALVRRPERAQGLLATGIERVSGSLEDEDS